MYQSNAHVCFRKKKVFGLSKSAVLVKSIMGLLRFFKSKSNQCLNHLAHRDNSPGRTLLFSVGLFLSLRQEQARKDWIRSLNRSFLRWEVKRVLVLSSPSLSFAIDWQRQQTAMLLFVSFSLLCWVSSSQPVTTCVPDNEKSSMGSIAIEIFLLLSLSLSRPHVVCLVAFVLCFWSREKRKFLVVPRPWVCFSLCLSFARSLAMHTYQGFLANYTFFCLVLVFVRLPRSHIEQQGCYVYHSSRGEQRWRHGKVSTVLIRVNRRLADREEKLTPD